MLSTLGILVQGGVRFVFSVLVGNAFGTLVLGAANAAISLALFASLVHPSAAAQTATKFVARSVGRATSTAPPRPPPTSPSGPLCRRWPWVWSVRWPPPPCWGWGPSSRS